MPNRLAGETSPYLLQHKDNPVDWYPWGPEALEFARREDKPILVSIGYSACHWCHVMAHESFEDPAIAAKMNELFVNVKIDREERPDLDGLYMLAVQALTGQGGWPLNVFLTAEGVPFYGGTYFPPEDRHGMPSWLNVLEAVANTWQDRREDVTQNAEQVRDFLLRANSDLPTPEPLRGDMLDAILPALHRSFDERHGGFGQAPKFPQPSVIEALLRIHERTGDPRAANMIRRTLDKMANGGLNDQVGGGFHRYSVDAVWLVPHFEKMLYDNAQLALAYLDAYRVLGDPLYRQVAEETLDYVAREMTGPEGQFYAAQDADSEGEEGKFYVWSLEELTAVLGEESARVVAAYYGASEAGNFEGSNILNVPTPIENVATRLGVAMDVVEHTITEARPRLYEARAQRVPPGRDEKAIASWNGMTTRAFAEAGRVLNRPDFIEHARRNAAFVLDKMRTDGKLLRSYKDGRASVPAFLEDYAATIDGLLLLHAATLEPLWLTEALALADIMVEEFRDPDGVGLFDTAASAETLVARPRDLQDGATPAGNSVAIDVLLRLAAMTGDESWTAIATRLLESLSRRMVEQPLAFGRFICALDFYLSSPIEVALAGNRDDPELQAMVDELFRKFRTNVVVGYSGSDDPALHERVEFLAHRPARQDKATAYVCENFACYAPVSTTAELAQQMDRDEGLAWQEL